MDISSIRLFVLVATRLSYGTAAAEMDIDPSSVSRKIKNLETELGGQLFNRSTRSMALSNFGARFLKHAEFILREYDLAIENAKGENESLKGTLKITTSIAFADRMLVPLIPKFMELYPEISVNLVPSDENLDLATEAIDVAIRLTPQVNGNYVITKLFRTRYAIYATPDYVKKHGLLKSPFELSERDTILYELPGFKSHWKFRSKDNKEKEFLVDIKGKVAVKSPAILRKMVLLGQGPSMLADWLVRRDVEEGKLVDILPGFEVTPITFDTGAWVLYPNNAYTPKKVKTFINFIKSELGEF